MSSIPRPLLPLVPLRRNALGLTIRDYDGAMSTLCAGCGHDSATAAVAEALWESDLAPHDVVKVSGIGCSSKTTAYFAAGGHGFNSVHGRMAPIATGANAANRRLCYLGISGDGDSLSIGLGHLCHAIRRNVNLTYIIENNGVYALTKGQFSPSADLGTRSKRGEANEIAPIDPMLLGLALGATFLARGFSGDKDHLVPILKAALAHDGFALIDVISPCIQFGNHEGSTKSYVAVREHEWLVGDLIDGAESPEASLAGTGELEVELHSGGVLRFASLPPGYDPRDRLSVARHLEEHRRRDEIPMGLLYVDGSVPDLHGLAETTEVPLNAVPFGELCPGSAALDELQAALR